MKESMQKEIIRKMYKVELIITKMYIEFLDHYPEHAPFWREMAADKMRHAGLVKELYEAEEHGGVNFDKNGIDVATLETFIIFIERIIKRAEQKMIDGETAMALALEIESSLITKKVYKSLIVQDSNCRHIPFKLYNGTLNQLHKVNEKLALFADNLNLGQMINTPPLQNVAGCGFGG